MELSGAPQFNLRAAAQILLSLDFFDKLQNHHSWRTRCLLLIEGRILFTKRII